MHRDTWQDILGAAAILLCMIAWPLLFAAMFGAI